MQNCLNVSLDGNKLMEENFHMLIKENSLIQHLSLRNCQISDIGAEKLGNELGNIRTQNTKLLSLNLSGNFITDNGAIEIARGLRTNRTLLVLNLSGNQIADLGACQLAETLSRFKMSHEEIVRRRTMRRERFLRDLSPHSRKTVNLNERPSSMAHKSPKDTNRIKKEPSNLHRDRSKSKDIQSGVIDKQGNTRQKGVSHKESVSGGGVQKKEKSKEVTISKDAQIAEKSSNKVLKSRVSKLKHKDSAVESLLLKDGLLRSISKLSNVQSNITNESDPLMDETEGVDGELLLIGNRTLLSLNLSRNKITLIGMKEFLSCVQLQISMALFNRNASCTGLLKLNLAKNDFPITDENYIKLMDLMKTRDPIANKTTESLADRDTNSVISKDGKDT
ncbi:leucine-rich repeat-containing 71-like isoform X6, partial [Brachionus plicatilis]